MTCLETTGLVHRYGRDTVLGGIDLAVPAGSIYGFLGPNGAGKTTTLRLVLGLLRVQQGAISVFGRDIARDRLAILRRVGSLIESPSLYEHLTARENLAVLNTVHRRPRARIDEMLALVGLAGTGGKRARQFSLGMKQRLGIAAAMLHGPDLLILDEPTNGLDPNGIVEMRALLQRLNRELGITIVVSSHLLAEIDRLATHVGIIARGRLVFQGTLAALAAQRDRDSAVTLRTGNDARALAIVRDGGAPIALVDGRLTLPALRDDDIATIVARLVRHDIAVHEVAPARADLERVFLSFVERAA